MHYQANDHASPQDWKRINGQPFTIDELLDPEVEREIGENPYIFEGGDTEIVGMVQQEMGLAKSDIEEIESDDDPEMELPSLKEMIQICQVIEEKSMVLCTEGSLEFT